MTQPVRVVSEACTLETAAVLVVEHTMGCLPIGSARILLYRFRQVFGEWMPKDGVEKIFAAARSRTVGEFMTRRLVTIDGDDPVEDAITAMQRTGYHRIPVGAEGRRVGVITRHDLLRLMVGGLH